MFVFNGKAWLSAWVALSLVLIVGGCAPIQDARVDPKRKDQLIYPEPPDEPRFVYERTIQGSADVLEQRSAGDFERVLTGAVNTSEVMAKPYAVAVHRGRVFVSDSAERFVKVFDIPEGRFFKIGEDDRGSLSKPLGLDVDDAGNLYVADAAQRTVMVYSRDGAFIRKIGGPNMFERLSSVTVDAFNRRLLVVDIGGVSSDKHRVRVFDLTTGEHLFDIGKRGNGQGELNLPRDAAVGKNGQIYVVDGGNFRIQVFDINGKYLQSFGQVGKQMGNFARPKEIAADRDGNVYVVDAAFGNFQIFTAEGDLLMFIGERSERNAPGRYMLPSGIYVDEDGRIYMVDQWFKKIDVFRPYLLPADGGFLGMRPKKVTAR